MNELAQYVEEMRARYPGLAASRMCTEAKLPSNLIYKIRDGVRPRPSTLQKLAFEGVQKTRQTEEQKWTDFRELMRCAGYEVPEQTRIVTDEEWEMVQGLRSLTPEQKHLVRLFFRSSDLDETLQMIFQRGGVRENAEVFREYTDASFTRFLELLGQMASLTPEERVQVLVEAIRHAQVADTGADN